MSEFTTKGQATRRRIIEGAADQFCRHGVDNTSLDDVRAATRTSKSQLFHYFPEGKAELLVAVAEHQADRARQAGQALESQLSDLTSWPQWQKWRDRVVERARTPGGTCPLGAFSSLSRPDSPQTQKIVTNLITHWQQAIASGIRVMQANGEIPASTDADQAAAALIAGVQGGMLIMLTTNRSTHLEAALDRGIAGLRDL